MDLLNKFIMDNFSGKTPCELNDVDTMLKGIKATLEDYHAQVDLLKKDVVDLGKENEALKLGRDAWYELAGAYQGALAIVCEEVETIIKDKLNEYCPHEWFTGDMPDDCDNDCPACLANYFLGRAKADREATENNRIVRDEIEGRKAMDGEDQRKAMKEALSDEA